MDVEVSPRMMIVKLQQHFPLRVTDWLVSNILLTWGLLLFYVTPETWDGGFFSGLRVVAGQETWATVAVVLGLARIVALFINGAMRRTPHVRAMGAFLSVFIWLQLTLGMLNAETTGVGLAFYPWLFLADIYNVYRAAQDARDSDVRHAGVKERRNRKDATSAEC